MKKVIKYIIIIVCAFLIALGSKYAVSYAKYAYNKAWNYYLESKGFYFDSNTLKENDGRIINNLWDGGHIYFDLRNTLNSSVVSETDIAYQVTCNVLSSSEPATCTILDTNSSTYDGVLSSFKTCSNDTLDGVDVKGYDKATCEMSGYDWVSDPAVKEIYFDVVGSDSATVEINVTSTSPYKKTLKGEFTLNKDKNITGTITHNYESANGQGNLVLSNSFDTDKCIRVSFDSNNLRLDLDKNKNWKYATDTQGYINEIDLKLEPKSSEILEFYEVVSNSYDNSNFTITELEECS